MSERGSFMPGECGPNEAIFSPPTEAGKVACLLCIQRVRCLEQTDEIIHELQISGYVGRTVVGGEVVAVPPAESIDPGDQFRTSNLQWNLDSLPNEPEYALIVLRQAYVANRLAIRQRHAVRDFTTWLSEGMDQSWAEPIIRELTSTKYWDALSSIGKQLHFQRCIAGKENKEPTRRETQFMHAVTRRFVEDAVAIRRRHIPSFITAAACHSPEFYDNLISYYRENSQISLRELSRLCGTNPLDPVTAIEARIHGAIPAKAERPKMSGSVETKLVDLDLPASVTELMAQLPEGERMAKYIQTFYDGLAADVAERRSISLLKDMIVSQADHSDLTFGIRTQLFKRHRGSAISNCERYKTALESLMSLSGPGFTPSLKEEFAYVFLEDAVVKAMEYGERYRLLLDACQVAKITPHGNALRAAARKEDMSSDIDRLGLRDAFEYRRKVSAASDIALEMDVSAPMRLTAKQLDTLTEPEKAAYALVYGSSPQVPGAVTYAFPQWNRQEVLDYFGVSRSELPQLVDEIILTTFAKGA